MYLLFLIFINCVLCCEVNISPVSYSKWLGGRNGSHSNANTLINQLNNFEIYSDSHPNITTVFQTQLTEETDDVVDCVFSRLTGCPNKFDCFSHIVHLLSKPALEYWEYNCQWTQDYVYNWFKMASNIYQNPGCNNKYNINVNKNINVLLFDFYTTYFNSTSILYDLIMIKNKIIANISVNLRLLSNNWMYHLYLNSHTPLYLSDLTVPGCHDAATYKIYKNSKYISEIFINNVCKNKPKLCDLSTDIIKNVVQSFAATQSGNSFEDMLNEGARYLDLRIIPVNITDGKILSKPINSSSQIDIHFSHNYVLLNFNLYNGLLEIKKFLLNNPFEIVLIYLSHFDGSVYNSDQFNNILPFFNLKLINIVETVFNNMIIKNCDYKYKLPSINDIYSKNKRGGVVLLYKTSNNMPLKIVCPINSFCPQYLFWNSDGSS